MKKSEPTEPDAGHEILRHVQKFSSLYLKELLELLRETISEWLSEKAPRIGASLASYTLLSLAPLLLVVVAVAPGFLQGRVAVAALRAKPTKCASLALRLHSLPTLMREHGVASTFEASGAAEFIPREIGNMFRDGTLASMTAKSSYYGLDHAWGSYDLMVSSERSLWMAWSTSALSVALAVVLWLAGTLRQRKREEALLRESEGRFRAIFGQAGVGVAQISLKGKVELANDRYCEVVGHTREDLLDKGTLEITHREDLKEQLTKMPRLLAG